jgi:hypothetical protein
MVAADSHIVMGHLVAPNKKLFRVKNHIIGLAGDYSRALKFVEWFGQDTNRNGPWKGSSSLLEARYQSPVA